MPTEKAAVERLHQRWMHSREEDTDEEMVFRPAHFDFPLARGREGFELKPDGTYVDVGIGPTDRRDEKPGKWKLADENEIQLFAPSGRAPKRRPKLTLKVVSVDPERLIVKK